MKKVIAFADEFGNNSFDFESQGSHFIVASVIVNVEELEKINDQIEGIRKRYFQSGEIKSSKVKDSHKRRVLILKSLEGLNFSVYALIIDKRRLFGEGFRYKQSFYKFLNGLLYKELYRTFPQLELIVDEHGGNDFMRSFKNYVEKNHIRTLFSGSDFNIHKSHNQLGVQLADLVAGTLGYIFDDLKKSDYSPVFFDLIKDKLISLNRFPKEYTLEDFDDKDIFSEFDSTIATISLNRIFDCMERTTGSTTEDRDKLNFLKLLLLFHQSKHYKKYTTSKEFIKHLNVNREKELNDEYFRTKIIGTLRDNGVLIASSRDGYKIPTSVLDLKKFVNHGKNVIIPMLRRIEECRNAILLATLNKYDILEAPEYRKLKEILEKVY